MKRKIALLMAVIIALLNIFTINVSAKVDLPTISKNKPLITYTYSSSGKVYAYKDANLKNKTGGYIACSTDECKIIEISGKAVKVIYPVSNGTKIAWFSRAEFTKRDLANDVADSSFTAKTKATTYKWKGKSNTFGSVAKGDKCYLLRGNENSDWVQIIYPVSKGHKMGWVKGSDYAKLCGKKVEPTSETTPSNNTKFDPIWPAESSYKVTTLYYYKSGCKHSCQNSYLTGIDIGGSGNVVATEKGTVIVSEYSTTSGFGNYIKIKHENGMISLYAHLKSRAVKTGDRVSKGQVIGIMGNSSAKYNIGVHLHFELANADKTGDAWKTYFKDKYKEKLYYEQNVYSNNKSYNKNHIVSQWINDNYEKKGSFYYYKTPSNNTKSLADIAKKEIGYQGTKKNGSGTGDYTKYGKWIGSDGTQWCASFVSWCVNQAGVSTKVVPKTPDCDTMKSKSNSYSKWNKNALNSIKKNDIIFFAKTSDLSDSNHVGIVTSVNKSKKTITVVEGNTGPYYGPDIVKEITYTVDSNSGKIVKGYKGYSFCGYISVN